MAITHVHPGEIVNVRPLGQNLAQMRTTALIKTDHFEVIRLVVPRGKHIPRHQTPGEVTLHCLEGRVRMELDDRTVELSAGELMYLDAHRTHDLKALEDSTILATIFLVRGEKVAWPSVLAEELSELS